MISTSLTQPTLLQPKEGKVGWMKWILRHPVPKYVNTETNKQKSCGFGPWEEVMLEVMQEVMSAETALIKWSEVFFIIVYYTPNRWFGTTNKKYDAWSLHYKNWNIISVVLI